MGSLMIQNIELEARLQLERRRSLQLAAEAAELRKKLTDEDGTS